MFDKQWFFLCGWRRQMGEGLEMKLEKNPGTRMETASRTVLVSFYCCNKLSHTQWLETTQVDSITILQARSPKQPYGAKIKDSQGWFLLGLQGKSHSFRLPGARGCPYSWALDPFLIALQPLTSIITSTTDMPLPPSYKSSCYTLDPPK